MTNEAFAERIAKVREVERVYDSTISLWRNGRRRISPESRLVIHAATNGRVKYGEWGTWIPDPSERDAARMRYVPRRKSRRRAVR